MVVQQQDLSGKHFFKKVYADKTLGIERDAKFVQPADYDNQINSADFMPIETDPDPEAEGMDQGVGTADDYNYIGPESKPVVDDEIKHYLKTIRPIIKRLIKKNQIVNLSVLLMMSRKRKKDF